MHNQFSSEKIVTFAETYWRDVNKYRIWKENAPKGDVLPVTSCFQFSSNEYMLK